MKKLLAILLMMPVIAFSQTDEKVTIKTIQTECVDVKILNEIVAEFDELPFIRGLSNREVSKTVIQHSMVLFVNAKTGTWTVVEKTFDGLYCFLAVGTSFEPVPAEVIDKLQNNRQKSRS